MTRPPASGPTPVLSGPDRGFRLSRTNRRVILLVHLVAALGWLGTDVVLGVLTFTGFFSDGPRAVAAAYTGLSLFAVPVLLTFGLTTLGTGILLALASRWGLLRSWWVAVKLAINLILTGLVPIALWPRVDEAARQSVQVDATLVDRLDGIRVDLLFPPLVSGAALLFAAVLGLWKPWGLTPYGRRATAGQRPAR